MAIQFPQTNIPQTWNLKQIESQELINGEMQIKALIIDTPILKPETSWKFEKILSEELINDTLYVKAQIIDQITKAESLEYIKVTKNEIENKDQIINEATQKLIAYKNEFHTENAANEKSTPEDSDLKDIKNEESEMTKEIINPFEPEGGI